REPWAVQVINWGYWGDVGIVATPAYRERMKKQGVRSISVEEGMQAVERLLSSNLFQAAFVKAEPAALHASGWRQDEMIVPSNGVAPRVEPVVETVVMTAAEKRRHESALQDLDDYGKRLLLQAFQRMGVFARVGEAHERDALMKQLSIPEAYERLFDQLLNLLAAYLEPADRRIAVKALPNEESRAGLPEHPELQPHVRLLDTCLAAYPDILSGVTPATDILFPDASVELVENVYKNNGLVDALNRLMRDAVVAYVEARLPDLRAGEKVTLLEVGAGTGGSSAGILKALQPYADIIDYVYTDISEHFVRYGARTYGRDYPFARFERLNIDEDTAEREPCDLVLAANVLHATRNIRSTLRRVKALLKTQGLLVLNEATSVESFSSLTFGLLEGWWRYEDPSDRLPGGPLLSAPMWKTVLEEEGFEHAGPVGDPEDGALLGQHIIVGWSDGLNLRESLAEPVA
ncbi:MAG: methyltransferase, partial [Verrucomicrobiota bacterium]